jgi:hypothetical protein
MDIAYVPCCTPEDSQLLATLSVEESHSGFAAAAAPAAATAAAAAEVGWGMLKKVTRHTSTL